MIKSHYEEAFLEKAMIWYDLHSFFSILGLKMFVLSIYILNSRFLKFKKKGKKSLDYVIIILCHFRSITLQLPLKQKLMSMKQWIDSLTRSLRYEKILLIAFSVTKRITSSPDVSTTLSSGKETCRSRSAQMPAKQTSV